MVSSLLGHLGGEMNLGIFVNTSDGFQDCWPPFFELFRQYGGSLCSCPVYLNTERAEFFDTRRNVYSTKAWPGDGGDLSRRGRSVFDAGWT